MGPSALYRHYANREALLRAVMWDAFVRFVAEVDDAVAQETEPREVVLALGRSYVKFAMANPGWFRLQFSRVGVAMELRHEDAQPKYPDIVLGALRAIFGDDDPALVEAWYLSAWSLAHGVASLTIECVFPHAKTDAERLAEADRILRNVLGTMGAFPHARRAAADDD